jgi:hypothetical protein
MNMRDVVIGATMGSALMFMMDPDRGSRRRALVRDKATSTVRKTRNGLGATGRDIANRAVGVAAIAAVPGVFAVTDQLEPHGRAAGVSALQSSGMPEPSSAIRQRHWAPATRTVVGASLLAAGVLMAVTATRGGHGEHDGGYADAAM